MRVSRIVMALVTLAAGAAHAQLGPPSTTPAPAPAPPPPDPAARVLRWDVHAGGQLFVDRDDRTISCDDWGILIGGGPVWGSAASPLSYGVLGGVRFEGNGLLLSAAPALRYRLGQDVKLELSLGPALRSCGVFETLEGSPKRWGAGALIGIRVIFADQVAVGTDAFFIHIQRTDEPDRNLTWTQSLTVTMHNRFGRYGLIALGGLAVLGVLAWATGPA